MSLWRYLLLPRLDGWFKWTICPATFTVLAASTGGVGHWPDFLVLWLLLDYLIYPARYQWNDIRGYASDLRHVNAARRTRLPGARNRAGALHHQRLSAVVLAARLGLALVVGAIVGQLPVVTVLMCAVFGVAALYEWLRSRPSSPTGPTVIGIWLLIGTGYGVRASLGAHAAGVSPLSHYGLAVFLFFAAFGAMFCLLTWALDGTSHDTAALAVREGYLRDKPHVAGLLRYVSRGDRHGRVLMPRGSLGAPWNIALVVAAGAGAVVGVGDAGAGAVGGDVPAPVLASLIMVSVVAALVLGTCASSRHRLAVGVAGAVALGMAAAQGGLQPAATAPVPWLLIVIGYTCMRASNYSDVKRSGRKWLAKILAPHTPATRVAP